MVKSSRNYPLYFWILVISHHCECLSCSCLAISKNRPIVPFESLFDQVEGTVFIDRLLPGIHSKDIIKDKFFSFFVLFDVEDVVVVANTDRRLKFCLPFVEGSDPDSYFHRLICAHQKNIKQVYPKNNFILPYKIIKIYHYIC